MFLIQCFTFIFFIIKKETLQVWLCALDGDSGFWYYWLFSDKGIPTEEVVVQWEPPTGDRWPHGQIVVIELGVKFSFSSISPPYFGDP